MPKTESQCGFTDVLHNCDVTSQLLHSVCCVLFSVKYCIDNIKISCVSFKPLTRDFVVVVAIHWLFHVLINLWSICERAFFQEKSKMYWGKVLLALTRGLSL